MRFSATQRAPRRVDKAANAPKFMSTQNQYTRLSAALVMRKLMLAKGLWNRFAMFRDIIEWVCASPMRHNSKLETDHRREHTATL
jgi:hypothetical protein